MCVEHCVLGGCGAVPRHDSTTLVGPIHVFSRVVIELPYVHLVT